VGLPILTLIITDRLGRRNPMILGAILPAISAVLFWLGVSKEMLFVARILQGTGAACTWTAGLALVAGYFVTGRVRAMGIAMIVPPQVLSSVPWSEVRSLKSLAITHRTFSSLS
jgi:MFS family permease